MRRPIVGYVLDGDTLCPECAADAYRGGDMEVDTYAWRGLEVGSDANGLPDALVSADTGDTVGVVVGWRLPKGVARINPLRCADCHTAVHGFPTDRV